MLFQFGPRSSLLLPFVVPGVVAVVWLLGRAARRGAAPDALLALLILMPTLSVSQWLLGYAGWFDSRDWYSTVMFYVPWRAIPLLGPAYYLYFSSLTNQEFRWRRLGWHLLPGALELGLLCGRGRLRPALVPVAEGPDAARFLWYQGRGGHGPRLALSARGAAAGLRPARAGRVPPLRPLPHR